RGPGRPPGISSSPPARSSPRLRLRALGLAVLIAITLSAPSLGAAPPPRLEADVLPILRGNCARCHGVTVHKGGLDLSSAAGIFRGGSSGTVVTPHKPDESPLYTVLHEGRMPPKK